MTKRKCSNCGRAMKQQFVDLKHCKCGLSWKKDIGYFERSSDMVFRLETQKKGAKGNKKKKVATIDYVK